MSSIHKKGDIRNCENYRGITVTSTCSRLYGRILKNLIEQEYQGSGGEEQCGFRAGRSCMDHIFCLKQLIEKRIATGRELHLLFIDLAKAYDSIPTVKLWEALQQTQINHTLIKAVKQLYWQSTTKIKVGQYISNGFIVTKGLRQGCCISPTLFKIYVEHLLQDWKRKCSPMGLPINDETTIYTLQFADDQVLIAQDKEDLEYMAKKLKQQYEKGGLKMNIGKTKYLCVGGTATTELELDNGEKISACEVYNYLGVKLNREGKDSMEIRGKITQGRRAIRKLNSIWWSPTISKKRKWQIYQTVVKSIVLYGAEAWSPTEEDKRRIVAMEMDALRRSCRVSRRDRVRNERIKQLMGVEDTIIEDIERKQLTWYGHVKRMTDTRLPKQTMEYVPLERRKRGRPRRSWSEGIRKSIRERELDEQLCQDRKEWRKKLKSGKRRQTL